MAGDWIKIKTDLHTDPAVIGMQMETGLEADTVVGKLVRVWAWANTHTEDGHAPCVTLEWLDGFLDCDGFASALVDVGWLDVGDGALVIPKFDRHNGKSAKSRSLSRERKRKQRERSGADAKRSAPRATQRNANEPRNGHGPSVTKTGQPNDREEKRKELTSPSPSPAHARNWRDIADQLFDLNVANGWNVVSQADINGASPEDVSAVLDHYRAHPGAWGPGALSNRIKITRARQDPSQGWPSPSKDYEHLRKALLEEGERQQRQERNKAERAANDQIAEVRDRREEKYGEQIAKLSREEAEELVEELFEEQPFILQMYRRQGVTGMVRLMLMSELEKREDADGA